ncbi:MAG: MioC protein [Kangiellaceae bacterium]
MNIDIVIGSVLGASEYVAEAVAAMLVEKGHSSTCYFTPNINDINFNNILVVVTSTHGAGDLPDNIQQFAKDLAAKDLSGLRAIIIGLGDSSYDTFCNGSLTIESIINDAGGNVLFPVFQIDVLHHPIPEDIAVEWLATKIDSIAL